jgi:hypothetical protein
MAATRIFDTARLLAPFLALAAAGCSKYMVARPPPGGFDAIIIPGCPSREDGSPTDCQLGRAGQAALLWKDGWARNFIVSGSDVHTPYVEAEAIAAAMTVLGVPPERIVLERDALHSDENVYYSLGIAQVLGFERLAIATNANIASLLCSVMVNWGHACSGIAMDTDALSKFMPPYAEKLHALRARRTEDWEPLDSREARIAQVNGYGRPPSYWLYFFYGWIGTSHRPIAATHAPMTWEARLRELDLTAHSDVSRSPDATPE